jgi:hypothetical protein
MDRLKVSDAMKLASAALALTLAISLGAASSRAASGKSAEPPPRLTIPEANRYAQAAAPKLLPPTRSFTRNRTESEQETETQTHTLVQVAPCQLAYIHGETGCPLVEEFATTTTYPSQPAPFRGCVMEAYSVLTPVLVPRGTTFEPAATGNGEAATPVFPYDRHWAVAVPQLYAPLRLNLPCGGPPPFPAGAELDPRYGKSVLIEPVSGRVLVKEPGKGRYTPLTGADVVPLGTAIDVGRGRVALTSAKDRSGTTQSAEFYYGAFKVGQTKAGKPLTQLRLIGFDPGECAQGGRAASASSKHAKGLWGDGKGNFQTIGHNGSATVRGTNWFTEDRCQGTLFKVKRGVVAVRDFSRRLDVTLRAGQSYLAPAP